MASTTASSTTPGPDWEKLAEQATGFLEALASTVRPTPEQEVVSNFFLALTGALGRPLTRTGTAQSFKVPIEKASSKSLTVVDSPEGASFYRVGDFSPGGKLDEGTFTPDTITLTNVDPTKMAFSVKLYDADKVLLARGVIIR